MGVRLGVGSAGAEACRERNGKRYAAIPGHFAGCHFSDSPWVSSFFSWSGEREIRRAASQLQKV
jgi:hypothetical protein